MGNRLRFRPSHGRKRRASDCAAARVVAHGGPQVARDGDAKALMQPRLGIMDAICGPSPRPRVNQLCREVVTQAPNNNPIIADLSISKVKMNSIYVWFQFKVPLATESNIANENIPLPHGFLIFMCVWGVRTNLKAALNREFLLYYPQICIFPAENG
jgi:hypothetical protein